MLSLSYGCLVTVNILQLFLTAPWVGLRCVIVVCSDHTNLLILSKNEQDLCLMVLDRLLTLSLSLSQLESISDAFSTHIQFYILPFV